MVHSFNVYFLDIYYMLGPVSKVNNWCLFETYLLMKNLKQIILNWMAVYVLFKGWSLESIYLDSQFSFATN